MRPQYSSRAEWNKNSYGYDTAARNGWLDICCFHMLTKSELLTRWSLQDCQHDALNYAYRYEWQKLSPNVYHAAKRNDWLDVCCSHMESRRKTWTKASCLKDARKYSTRKEWNENSTGYSVAKSRGWLPECTAHMIRTYSPRQSVKS